MKYVILKCPKCGYTQEVPLEHYNYNRQHHGHPYTCPNDYWDKNDFIYYVTLDKHIELEVYDVVCKPQSTKFIRSKEDLLKGTGVIRAD